MPKVTRSIEEVDAVRERILESAFKILVANGFEKLSMAKVGAKMKMTAANLYNYFGCKDELLIAIHKKAYAMLYNKMSDAVSLAETPLARCQNITRAFVEFGIQNARIYDIMYNRAIPQYSDYVGTPQEAAATEEFRNSLQVLSLSVNVIREYRETRPDLPYIDPKTLNIRCFSSLHGIISLYNSRILHQIADDPEATLESVIESAMRFVTG